MCGGRAREWPWQAMPAIRGAAGAARWVVMVRGVCECRMQAVCVGVQCMCVMCWMLNLYECRDVEIVGSGACVAATWWGRSNT